MMDFVFGDEFDQMTAAEFFGTLKAMDRAEAPEHVLVKGHIEGNRFIPHAVEGQHWKANAFAQIRKPLSKSCLKPHDRNNIIR